MAFLLIAVGLVCAGCGFLLGRGFPTHHYEHLAGPDVGYARYLFIDTGTGEVCNAMKPFYDKATQAIQAHMLANMEQWDKTHPNQAYGSSPLFAVQEGMSSDEYGQRVPNFFDQLLGQKVIPPDRSDYIPACGKQ